MKKFAIIGAVLLGSSSAAYAAAPGSLGSSSAAYAAAPGSVTSFAMSCCDLVLACCNVGLSCCP